MARFFKHEPTDQSKNAVLIDFGKVCMAQLQAIPAAKLKVWFPGTAPNDQGAATVANLDHGEAERFMKEFEQYLQSGQQ
jgi:hypothetical protein